MSGRASGIVGIFVAQVVCAAFFISDILSSYIGFSSDPVPWEFRELIEIGAALGLGMGVVFGAWALWTANRDRRLAEKRLQAASGAFMELLRQRFVEWKLTPAEADVAFFAIKGLSTAEIAALRRTSEGTVKAQTNAIYRKAGVSGRPQLLSLFIDDLMQDDNAIRPRLTAVEPVPLPSPAEARQLQIEDLPPAA